MGTIAPDAVRRHCQQKTKPQTAHHHMQCSSRGLAPPLLHMQYRKPGVMAASLDGRQEEQFYPNSTFLGYFSSLVSGRHNKTQQ
jgi:hypothetical protein